MLTGVILAGNYALLPFLNEKLIERQVREMQRICTEVIVVTNDPKSFLPVLKDTVRIITDFIPGKGPISGIHAALSLAVHDELWIVGGDLPYISAEAAQLLFHYKQVVDCDAVVPSIAGQLHPLHAIYTKNALKTVTKLMALGRYDLKRLIESLYHVVVDESEFVAEKISLQFVDSLHKKV